MSEAIETPTALTVPLNADGSIATLPEQLEKFLLRKANEIADAKVKRVATAGPDPVTAEKLRQSEAELQVFRIKEAEAQQRYDDALKLRDDNWTKKVESEKQERDKAVGQLAGWKKSEIRAAAMKAGARDESLDELGALLESQVSFTDTYEFQVQQADGSFVKGGIDALVADYLQKHAHHLRAAIGVSGNARGGASLSGAALTAQQQAKQAYDVAIKAWQQRPTTDNLLSVEAAKDAVKAAQG